MVAIINSGRAALLGLCLASAFFQAPSALAEDVTPPAVTNLTITPSTPANVTDGPAEIVVTTTLTDDDSGVSYANLTFRSGQKYLTAYFFNGDRISGTENNGVYQTTITVPRYVAGTFTLDSANLGDNEGNNSYFDSGYNVNDPSHISKLGVTGSFTTTSSVIDSAPPAITSVTFSPPSVDASSGEATITATITATDDLSGVASGWMDFESNGLQAGEIYFDSYSRISGTANNGVYTATFTIPQYAAGTYELNEVGFSDEAGNSRYFYKDTSPSSASHISHAGFTASFTVTSTPADAAAPVATSISAPATPVDTTNGSADVPLTIAVTDDLSGFSYGYATFTNGSRYITANFDDESLTAGTATNGTYSTTLSLPRYATGTFTLSAISLTDSLGRTATFSDDLESSDPHHISHAGVSASFDAISEVADSAPPVVTNLSVSPTTVDITNGTATVTVTATITDDLSGLSYAYLEFSNGSRSVYVDLSDGDRISGNSTSGTYQATLEVPQYAAGTYQLSEVSTEDLIGNSKSYADWYDSSDPRHISHAGVTASFKATTTNPDTIAPVVQSLTPSPTHVDVTSGAASVTITIAATDNISGVEEIDFGFSNGKTSLWGSVYSANRVSGTAQNGTYTTTISVPRYAQGTYKLSSLNYYDEAGNSKSFDDTGDPSDPTDISHAGVTASFTATSSITDSHAPVITSITPSPATVDVTSGDATIMLTVTATDDLSGLDYGELNFSNGAKTIYAYFDSSNLVSGTINNGTYTTYITVPQYAAGTYHLVSLDAVDAAGNDTEFDNAGDPDDPTDISHAGVTASFTATSSVTDTTAPAYSNISVSPHVDVSTDDGYLTFKITVTDDLSGFSWGEAYFSNGSQTVSAYFEDSDRISGTETNGHYEASLTVPKGKSGTYVLTDIDLFDNAGNEADIDDTSLSFTATNGTTSTPPPAATNAADAAKKAAVAAIDKQISKLQKQIKAAAKIADPVARAKKVKQLKNKLKKLKKKKSKL